MLEYTIPAVNVATVGICFPSERKIKQKKQFTSRDSILIFPLKKIDLRLLEFSTVHNGHSLKPTALTVDQHFC